MTTEMVSEQAALAGDVPTSETEGQLSTGVLSEAVWQKPGDNVDATEAKAEEPKEEQKAPVVPETLDPKDKRKSDAEWQKAQEAKKEASSIEKKLEATQRELERIRFERDFPIALEYKEQLDAMDKDPRWAPFTWQERLDHVHKPDMSSVRKDQLNQAAKSSGSVMSQGKAQAPQGNDMPFDAALWWGSPEKARKAYEKYGKR